MISYGDGLLNISKSSIEIDTGLSEREATHGKVFQSFNEKGIIISKNDNGELSFSDYFLTDNFSKFGEGRKTESVFVKGPGFSGKPLSTIFDEDREMATKAINILSQAVEYSFENNISIPNVGALGIIVGDEKSTENQLLILPPTIFEKSLNSRGDSFYSQYCGIYKKDVLKSVDSWRFTLSCYAYRVCSEFSPFSNLDSIERVWDYVDNKFVPLEISYELLDKNSNVIDSSELFKIIKNNLTVLPLESIKKSKRYKFIKPQSLPLPKIPESFSLRKLDYSENLEFQKQEKKLKKTRFCRKYNLQLKIASVSFVVLLIILAVTIFDISQRPSTLGLSSEQSVMMFYSGVNELDSEKLTGALAKKSIAKHYQNFVKNMYVTAHVRESYESEKITYTLEEWLNLLDPINNYYFGVSDLSLILLQDGENEKIYQVEYYISYNDPGFEIFLEKCVDTVTVSYEKDRWQITEFNATNNVIQIDSQAFFNDVQTLIEEIPDVEKSNQGGILAEKLQEKYVWLPSPEEAKAAYAELMYDYYY